MVYSGPDHRQPWQDDEMVFTQYHIEQPTSYPENYPERQEGEPAGPLTVMVAGRKGIDAYETAQMQMDPGFQDRWRKKLMREWCVSQRPLVNMVEDLDNEGVIRGYIVIMNMTDPETGVAKINHRYVSMEEIVQRVGV